MTELNFSEIYKLATSKIEGNHNWTVRLDIWGDTVRVRVGRHRVFKNRDLLSEYIKFMVEHNTKWVHFTYKKDLMELVNALEKNENCSVSWLA